MLTVFFEDASNAHNRHCFCFLNLNMFNCIISVVKNSSVVNPIIWKKFSLSNCLWHKNYFTFADQNVMTPGQRSLKYLVA